MISARATKEKNATAIVRRNTNSVVDGIGDSDRPGVLMHLSRLG